MIVFAFCIARPTLILCAKWDLSMGPLCLPFQRPVWSFDRPPRRTIRCDALRFAPAVAVQSFDRFAGIDEEDLLDLLAPTRTVRSR